VSEDRLKAERFPRASAYHPEWIGGGASGGANVLWLTEWLTEAVELRPGMRVLDLGCGRALSSIFLHREFGVRVWAVDLWFDAGENLRRIEDAGVREGVFPIHADARALPFAAGFFDAIVSIDSFYYYGTDDLYLNALLRFLRPGGQLGIAGAGVMQEIDGAPPEHLRAWWEPGMSCLHTAAWWRRHWERTGLVDVECADAMPDGWRYWLDWQLAVAPGNAAEIRALEADGGRVLGYVRAVARRRVDAKLDEPIVSVRAEYTRQPLLREERSASLGDHRSQ
jgi:SAM-dependent methyltransferase